MLLEPTKTGWLYCSNQQHQLSSSSSSSMCTLSTDLMENISHASPTLALRGDSSSSVHDSISKYYTRGDTSNSSRCRKEKELHAHAQSCNCKLEDYNLIAFQCPNIVTGDVKMEYMTSHG
jgi:hypothetical protein